MKFSDMVYERPNIEDVKSMLTKATEDFKAAESFEAADSVFLSLQKENKHIQTLATLVSVRHSIDTNDKFYEEENSFWDNVSPELEEYSQKFTLAMLESPFKQDFINKYGKLLFQITEIGGLHLDDRSSVASRFCDRIAYEAVYTYFVQTRVGLIVVFDRAVKHSLGQSSDSAFAL